MATDPNVEQTQVQGQVAPADTDLIMNDEPNIEIQGFPNMIEEQVQIQGFPNNFQPEAQLNMYQPQGQLNMIQQQQAPASLNQGVPNIFQPKYEQEAPIFNIKKKGKVNFISNNAMYNSNPQPSAGVQQLLFGDQPDEENTILAAIIVTVCSGSTYDPLFQSTKQDASEGSRVMVYRCANASLAELVKAMKGESNEAPTGDMALLLRDLDSIEDPSCVAINYECCSGCSDAGFPMGGEIGAAMKEISFFLQKGYLVMCSDFSLKALIHEWNALGDKTEFGPNPFIKTDEHSSTVTLTFNSKVLQSCVSAQLQSVGELCPEQDNCVVHCMGGTIRYSVKPDFQAVQAINVSGTGRLARSDSLGNKFINLFSKKAKNTENKEVDEVVKVSKTKVKKRATPYTIEILTVCNLKSKYSCAIEVPDWKKVKEKKEQDKAKDEEEEELPMRWVCGDAGHVVLHFNGAENSKDLKGKLLASMTHWSELVKLGDNVQDDVLFQVAAKNLGTESTAYKAMQQEYLSFGGMEATGEQKKKKKAWISSKANCMVQQQAPCSNLMKSSLY